MKGMSFNSFLLYQVDLSEFKKMVLIMKEVVMSGAVLGPYSPGVIAQGSKFVFISGQIADDLEANISVQTKQVLTKIQKILSLAKAQLSDVAKCTVYLANWDDFSKMNEEYAKFFSDEPPARAGFEVSRLPLDALIEIEAIAILD
jgi:2-iminobutanoate/2-iminopropanoate deaminase